MTIVDIAREAGVSKATVSRALREDPDTSASTREHVIEVARSLGYVVNAHARALRSAAPVIVGAILRDSSNPVYGALHVALQRRANARGLSIVAMTAVDPDEPEEELRAIEALLSLRVSGILVCSATVGGADIAALSARVPMVSLASPITRPAMHGIAYDERAAGRDLAAAIIASGHRRVAVHDVPRSDSPSVHIRTTAMMTALRRSGADVTRISYTREHDEADGLRRAQEYGATAIACANDAVMLRYMALAESRGIRVPVDISMIGCDHVGPFAAPALGLTSYRLPVEEVASAGVDLMCDLLDDPGIATRRQRLRGEFIPGRTLAPIATADAVADR
ncbi:LacI family DNA-binding transcriptional regulator [Microbacterium sp. 1.5R]|uniref:LacI family DNA-binding transcriptional regulator n=1 Tax=Microbacterium sp. 1.5R TaxID=1916917 RepID=UPI0016428EC6|nr:LacI family DNA-binding transcriptional regulator [Microbacterium sp. 1.5R]